MVIMDSLKLAQKTKVTPNSKIIVHIECWHIRKPANDNNEQYALALESANDNEPDN